jgi:hypothetical protein
VARLVAELDSPVFTTRQKAAAVLEKLGDGAVHLIEKASGKATEEGRRRLEQIRRRLEGLTPEALRQIRVVEVLERTRDPGARRLLDELAGGVAGARLTREAAAASRRLRT